MKRKVFVKAIRCILKPEGLHRGLHRRYIGNPISVRTFLNSLELFVGLLIKL